MIVLLLAVEFAETRGYDELRCGTPYFYCFSLQFPVPAKPRNHGRRPKRLGAIPICKASGQAPKWSGRRCSAILVWAREPS
jgi:hypothetical protein